MNEQNSSFVDEELRDVLQQTIEASKNYEDRCKEIISGFSILPKLSMDSIDDYAGKSGIAIYWQEDTLVHIKMCQGNPLLKLAGVTNFSYTEVEDIYLIDLLNTINLEMKPKFVIDLKGMDKEIFLHIQKLDLVAEGLDVEDEEAEAFCIDAGVTIYESGSGVKYVNLGNFAQALLTKDFTVIED